MADQRISQLDQKLTLASGDFLVIVDNAPGVPLDKMDKRINAEDVGLADGELRLTPKTSSTGPEGTVFFDSDDKCIYVGVDT